MEKSTETIAIEQLAHWFQLSRQSHFTGQLDLIVESRQHWNLFFRLGRLVWATGGNHRFRRWQRVLQHFCPALPQRGLQLDGKAISLLWEYLVLMIMVKRQWVRREQAIALIEHVLTEVLFDIIQDAQNSQLVAQSYPNTDHLGEALAVLNTEQTLAKSLFSWKAWTDAGLAAYSPNLAPLIRRPDELRQRVSSNTYHRLETMLDGQSSLRELAIATQQDLIVLTRSLVAFAAKDWIGFQPVPDFRQASPSAPKPHAPAKRQPLIACVDDSLQVCESLERILTTSGYRFIGVQDSLQALPILLENKPNLIFLDLVMPVASGYEICAQLRRVSIFKETPIIILTGNDGIVDRVRAKIVGASGFLAKPVEADKVLEMVRRQLVARDEAMNASGHERNQFARLERQHPSVILPNGL